MFDWVFTAVRILNICVVTLSAFGLVSTFILLYGLVKVIKSSGKLGNKHEI